jgi:hypothetical protein
MQATAPVVDDEDFGAGPATLKPVDARKEDAYWQRWYRRERYFQPDLDYEDYAPAYCVGYIGYAQYGGAFADAEPWLCSNWLRIKGDSRLGLEDAKLAMRSAWDRMARQAASRASVMASVRLFRRRLRMPSFRLGATVTR